MPTTEEASWVTAPAAVSKETTWTHQPSTREQNKRLRSIYEDEGEDYGRDATEDELPSRRKKAVELRKNTIEQVFKAIKSSQHVDFCFLVDVTSSMRPHLEAVHNAMKTIVTTLTERRVTYAGTHSIAKQLRLAFVGYRDFGDARQFELHDFTEDVKQFRQFLNSVEPQGGGDVAEDVFGGLEKCGNLQWSESAGTRIVFHIADAPCHGAAYHGYDNGDIDCYPEGDPSGRSPAVFFETLLRKKVQYHFGKITDYTDKMLVKFAEAYGEKILEFDVKDPSNIVETISALVAISQSQTVSSSLDTSGGAKLQFTLDATLPSWKDLPKLKCNVLTYAHPNSIEDIVRGAPLFKEPTRPSTFRIAHNPFAKGAERIAYWGREESTFSSTDIVLKEYIRSTLDKDSAVRYEGMAQMQTIAAFLASQFNDAVHAKTDQRWRIKFLDVCVVWVPSRPKGRHFMSFEPRFTGEFEYVRFSNNADYEMRECTALDKGISIEFVQLLMAFSHWTYHVTGGYLMVVDLQGILGRGEDGERTLELTDPAIHCTDSMRFGRTNYGREGMQTFFNGHSCTDFCRKLGLPAAAASS